MWCAHWRADSCPCHHNVATDPLFCSSWGLCDPVPWTNVLLVTRDQTTTHTIVTRVITQPASLCHQMMGQGGAGRTLICWFYIYFSFLSLFRSQQKNNGLLQFLLFHPAIARKQKKIIVIHSHSLLLTNMLSRYKEKNLELPTWESLWPWQF